MVIYCLNNKRSRGIEEEVKAAFQNGWTAGPKNIKSELFKY